MVAFYCPISWACVFVVAIVVCSLEGEEIAPLLTEKTYCEVDFELFGQSL